MSKVILATVFTAFMLTAGAYNGSENVPQLNLSLADPRWDGENVPDGQQCRKFGGKKAETPALKVSEIPATTDALVVEYGDYSWGSDGGHGKIGYHIEPGTESIVIPSVPGHSFDLPEGFFLVKAHLAPHWDAAGAYLPPCSSGSGSGHIYYVVVKAIVRAKSEDEEHSLTAEGEIAIGKY